MISQQIFHYDITIILYGNTMNQKIAVTLDEELVAFLDAQANGNCSDYINNLLAQQRKQCKEAELIAALKSDALDL